MSNPSDSTMDTAHIELAAGGLIWRGDSAGARIAVVHRKKYRDWTLPKGRPEPGETMEETALREAMEETGTKAVIGTLAGTYCYIRAGKPKIVLVWHMTHDPARYETPASREEVDEVAWLSPEEAMQRLTHPTEKQFMAQHCTGRRPSPGDGTLEPEDARKTARPLFLRRAPKAQLERLAVAIQTLRERFAGTIDRSPVHANTWWAQSARRSLEAARSGLHRHDLNGGWGGVHDTERFLVFGMTDEELLARAASLYAETRSELTGWRETAIARLFAPIALADWMKPSSGLEPEQRALLENVVVECLGVLHDQNNTTYHRVHLVVKQLQFLVFISAIIHLAALTGSYFLTEPGSMFSIGNLGAVMLAGALGGVVSAMYQLSRVGRSKIPEALLHGLITTGRPLVGASSALFLYAVLQSNVISLIDASKVTLEAALVLAFVAGFSEQFVLTTVAKVTGDDTGQQSNPGGSTQSIPVPESSPSASTAGASKSTPEATSLSPATDKPVPGKV